MSPRTVLLLFGTIYLYAFPFFGELRSANELPRVLTTQEIVERGTFRLDARMGELGSTFDIAPTPGGHYYQNKAPGASLLAVPAYLVCKLLGQTSIRASTWAFRFSVCILPALVFLWFFHRFAARFSPEEPGRRAALVAYALGSPALVYALVFMSHQPSAVAAGSGFIAATALARGEARRPHAAALLAGLLAAASVMMDYQSAIAAAGIGIYLLARSPRRARDTALFSLGAAPVAFALAAYHHAAFGSIWKTGYSLSNPVHARGFFGVVGPSPEAFFVTLLDPSNGLLVLAPWVLLVPVGAWAVFRDPAARVRIGAEAAACLAIFLGYVLFMGSLVPSFSRAGWCVGPRYLTVALPFAGWLAAAGFAHAHRRTATRILASAAVLVSTVTFVVAATTYPHWPELLRNPLHELSFRLLGAGYAVHSLGTLVGLRGFASLAPLYALVLAVSLWLLWGGRAPGDLRRRAAAATAACALTVVVVVACRFFPSSGPYAERAFGFVTSTWEPRR